MFYIYSVQKLTAILLLAVFFTAQYARQLSYAECPPPESTAASVGCACGIEADTAGTTTGTPADSRTHIHISTDEYFTGAAGTFSSFVILQPENGYPQLPAPAISKGASSLPGKPPEVS